MPVLHHVNRCQELSWYLFQNFERTHLSHPCSMMRNVSDTSSPVLDLLWSQMLSCTLHITSYTFQRHATEINNFCTTSIMVSIFIMVEKYENGIFEALWTFLGGVVKLRQNGQKWWKFGGVYNKTVLPLKFFSCPWSMKNFLTCWYLRKFNGCKMKFTTVDDRCIFSRC